MPIHVPPLRERRDDIPALVRHFADLFARDNNLHRQTFTAAAMEKLQQQHWRGNIRELRNFVERLMIMTTERVDRREGHSGGRRHPRRPGVLPPASVSAVPAPRSSRGCRRATLQEFKSGSERAYLVREAEGEWLEHLEDRRGDRYAAQ